MKSLPYFSANFTPTSDPRTFEAAMVKPNANNTCPVGIKKLKAAKLVIKLPILDNAEALIKSTFK